MPRNKTPNTQHIRDASPEQARQLAYHYYSRAVKAERRAKAAEQVMHDTHLRNNANLTAMAMALDAIREIVCPEKDGL